MAQELLVVAIVDGRSTKIEQLLDVILGALGPDEQAMLALLLDGGCDALTELESRILAVLDGVQGAKRLSIEVAPFEPGAILESLLGAARLFWSDNASHHARVVGLRCGVLESLDAANWRLAIATLRRKGIDDLVACSARDVASFCDAGGDLQVLQVRVDRLGDSQYSADVIVYSTALRHQMVWQFIGLDPSTASVTFPSSLAPLTEEVLTSLADVLLHCLGVVVQDANMAKSTSVSFPLAPAGAPVAHHAGEGRPTPGFVPNELYIHSAKRYAFAAGLCQGKHVLDLSCGAGYGSRLLAGEAQRVIAVDVDPEPIAYARKAYAASNLTFDQIPYIGEDSRLPYDSGVFDVVTNFEVLEHVPWAELDVFIDEIKRVVRPDGTVVLSTPNKTVYRHYPDPHHISLMQHAEFRALLEAHFEEVHFYSQLRKTGSSDLLAEFDIVPGLDTDREIFLAVCRGPRAVRLPLTLQGRQDPLRILIFNWHEPYLCLLAKTGHHFDVADWMVKGDGTRGWDERKRPVPPNLTLYREPAELAAKLASHTYDLAVTQTLSDLEFLENDTVPVIHLAHNSCQMDGGESARVRLSQLLAQRGGHFAAISEMKRASWRLDGAVILPGLDVRDYPLGTLERDEVLVVGNLLRERPLFDFDWLQRALDGVPCRVMGFNPGIAGSALAVDYGALLDAYAQARVYAHATYWPNEDGYNLALLEAMATGAPVVALPAPNLPIVDGESGYVAQSSDDARIKLHRLLEDSALARRMGLAARDMVRRQFGILPFISGWNDLFVQAVEAGLGRSAKLADWPEVTSRGKEGSGKMRVLLAATGGVNPYYERAFREVCDLITVGPDQDADAFERWRALTEQHALKRKDSGAVSINLNTRLLKPRDLPWPPGVVSMADILKALPEGWQPDLLVWMDDHGQFLPIDLNILSCPTVCMMGDSHVQADWRLEYARQFSHVYVMFNREHISVFESGGCDWVGWLPAACEPAVHQRYGVEKAYDVGFVGQTHPQLHRDRVRLLERLRANGFDVVVDTLYAQEMAMFFGRSRVVFNRSLAGDLNMRVFEALACGAFLLTDRLADTSGMYDLFQDGTHLVTYEEGTLEAKLRYYLDHPEERERIAARGRAEVLGRHTYAHRVQQILALAKSPVAIEVDTPVGSDYYHNQRPEVVALVPKHARRILDVGCGAGGLGALLKQQTECEVIGIECVAAIANRARLVLDDVLALDLDGLPALPFARGYFDCMVFADVLEHLREPAAVLNHMRQYLAPDGVIVCSIPNIRHQSVLLKLLVEGRWEYADEGILDRTHLRFYTLAEIQQLMDDTGFTLEQVNANMTTDSDEIAPLRDAVKALGGDVARFSEEARVFQYLLVARQRDALVPAAPALTETAPNRPRFSILIPLHNAASSLMPCLSALVSHTPDELNYEVVLVDDASTDGTAALLDVLEGDVTVLTSSKRLGMGQALNQAIACAKGEYVVLLAPWVQPEPGWLDALLAALEADEQTGMAAATRVTSNDEIGVGLAFDADRRPKDTLLTLDAIQQTPLLRGGLVNPECVLIRRSLSERIGGFDEGFEGPLAIVDYGLRACLGGYVAQQVIPSVILSEGWLPEHATPGDCQHLQARWGVHFDLGHVPFNPNPAHFHQPGTWDPPVSPLVSVVMPVFNKVEFTRACLLAFSSVTPPDWFEILIVDNASTDETVNFLACLEGDVTVVRNETNLGFARACNQMAARARGRYLVFLNNDTIPQPGWLEALVMEVEAQADVGIVGSKLLYPETETIQHAGMVMGEGHYPVHVHRHAARENAAVNVAQDVDMVTGACLLVRTELFHRLGGFDEGFVNGFEDVDLCLGARTLGYRVRYTPLSVLYHFEGTSEGRFDREADNFRRFHERWGGVFGEDGRMRGVPLTHLLPEPPAPDALAVQWEGEIFTSHSFSVVNREITERLAVDTGVQLVIHTGETPEFVPAPNSQWGELVPRVNRALSGKGPDVVVRHVWPPDFTPPATGAWVMIQPWEFGGLPQAWVDAMRDRVDELWVYSHWLRDRCIESGLPPERVQVVPLGVDCERFSPEGPSYPLTTRKRHKFLFVGGTVARKGLDILLDVYLETFSSDDDVCLVIKGTCAHSVYRHNNLNDRITSLQARSVHDGVPEIEFISEHLDEASLASLYRACDVLVHPYRAEGFGLTIAEAMATELPVIVTGHGAALDFCDESNAFLIPAVDTPVAVGLEPYQPSATQFYWAEPDREALAAALREVLRHAGAVREKGRAGRDRIVNDFSWALTLKMILKRFELLRRTNPRRFISQG